MSSVFSASILFSLYPFVLFHPSSLCPPALPSSLSPPSLHLSHTNYTPSLLSPAPPLRHGHPVSCLIHMLPEKPQGDTAYHQHSSPRRALLPPPLQPLSPFLSLVSSLPLPSSILPPHFLPYLRPSLAHLRVTVSHCCLNHVELRPGVSFCSLCSPVSFSLPLFSPRFIVLPLCFHAARHLLMVSCSDAETTLK